MVIIVSFGRSSNVSGSPRHVPTHHVCSTGKAEIHCSTSCELFETGSERGMDDGFRACIYKNNGNGWNSHPIYLLHARQERMMWLVGESKERGWSRREQEREWCRKHFWGCASSSTAVLLGAPNDNAPHPGITRAILPNTSFAWRCNLRVALPCPLTSVFPPYVTGTLPVAFNRVSSPRGSQRRSPTADY